MAGTHAKSLMALPMARLVALGAPEVRPSVAEVVESVGGEVTTDAHAIIDRGDLDAVIVATPNNTHAEFVTAAAQAGISVFCEKPLTADLAQAESVMATVQRYGTKLAVGHVVRYFPAYEAIHREVVSGTIGTPGVARMRRAGGGPAGGWFADPAQSGGIVFDLAIHNIDWALWTLGPAARVSAVVAGEVASQSVMITIAHEGGALSLVEASWGWTPGFLTSVEVSGSEGLIRSGPSTPKSFSFIRRDRAEPARPFTEVSGTPDPYRRELAEALVWFAGGEPPRIAGGGALEAVRVASAVTESAESGQPVALAGNAKEGSL